MVRLLVDRWRFGSLPEAWDRAKHHLAERLRDLERILQIAVAALEHPTATLQPRVVCTGATTINSGTFADITGATVTTTPEVDGQLLVHASFYVTCTTVVGTGDLFEGTLTVNGAQEAAGVLSTFGYNSDARMLSQDFPVSVQAGTSYTLKLQARRSTGTSTYSVNATQTGFTWMVVPNLYRVS